jgi:hypothetical protein
MKISELRKLIIEAKKEEIKEYNEYGQELETDSFAYRDGWNKQTLDNAGIMDWLKEVEGIAYELKNARRGSYAIKGDDGRALFATFMELKNGLDDILNNIDELI